MRGNTRNYAHSILKLHPREDWERVSLALASYGAKQLFHTHPDTIANLNTLEQLAYCSARQNLPTTAMKSFFDELKVIKENLSILDKKVETTARSKKTRDQLVNKENLSEERKCVSSMKRLDVGSCSPRDKSLLRDFKENMKGMKTPSAKAVKLVFEKKEFTEPYLNRIPQPLIITKSKEVDAPAPAIEKTNKPLRKQRPSLEASVIYNKGLKREEPIIEPKYLKNVQSRIRNQIISDKQHKANKKAAEIPINIKSRTQSTFITAVSYTHLTLPTICSV
eukprot:TRINITY_DN14585_c0_g1_i4.p1 TRINITY_DN14585_c0_g1~~TRINITY_DN14585_c0_g1_i4.p1  ORF type:complete len:279 (-),score=66.70 TRINITY_DN14585_c0_g1_i4:47-883(-)